MKNLTILLLLFQFVGYSQSCLSFIHLKNKKFKIANVVENDSIVETLVLMKKQRFLFNEDSQEFYFNDSVSFNFQKVANFDCNTKFIFDENSIISQIKYKKRTYTLFVLDAMGGRGSYSYFFLIDNQTLNITFFESFLPKAMLLKKTFLDFNNDSKIDFIKYTNQHLDNNTLYLREIFDLNGNLLHRGYVKL